MIGTDTAIAQDTGLPVIDLTPLQGGTDAGLKQVAAEIGEAARSIGFFYIKNHGISPALVDDVFAAARQLFASADDVKMALTRDFLKTNRGYVPMKAETLDPKARPDLKEAFNLGWDLGPDDPRILSGEPFRAVNLWPDFPGWRETLLAYFDAVWALGRGLHRAIAADLGLEQDYFEDKLDAPLATLRLLHYPPQPDDVPEGQVGAGTHTDYGNLTLLMPGGVGGLEVQRRDGTWIAAPALPGCFVCNIGDCLMRWTNDTYVSTPHRVVNRAGRDRYAIAFFLDPNPDALVECLETCQGPDRPPIYPPVLAADYVRMKLDATYDTAG
ncbi:isopenicillin N synthase family oxygenase [Roseibium sp. RKSG952]|nr:2-oxoglutarate and iron-dependent oxygenase domain-containing protein [Roseibium sp. RKSG952]MTH96284.1 isopenicillin N synthase family oxygenase [Roseibium sp. RKSG952]